MNLRSLSVCVALFFIWLGSIQVYSQKTQPIDAPIFHQKESEERSWGVEERLAKMRIEKDKKDYQELLARGEELNQISEELVKSFEAHGTLSDYDLTKLATAEKLAKKIRNDLGGSNDNEEIDSPNDNKKVSTMAEAVHAIQSTSEKLFSELKRSTRFTISVPAIQSSNAMLRLIRFLHVRN